MEENVETPSVTSLFGVAIDDNTIAGLAGVKNAKDVSPEERSKIKRAVNKGFQMAASSKAMSHTAAAFVSKATRELRPEEAKKIFDGSSQLQEYNVYVAADLSLVNDNIMNPTSLDKNVGVTNLVSQKLENEKPFLVDSIKMGYQRTAAATAAAAGIYSANGQALPAYLLGGNFELWQDDKLVLRLPIADYFTDPGVAVVPNGEVAGRNGYYRLSQPVMLFSKSPIVFKVIGSYGQSIPASGTNATLFKVNLRGLTAATRSTSI